MSTPMLQGRFRRGRMANRLGIVLLFFLLFVLVASLYHGIRSLGAV